MKITFFHTLAYPYAMAVSKYSRFLRCVILSIFVFLVLWFLQTFGLNPLYHNTLLLSSGFVILAFVLMMGLNFVLYPALPDFFKEEKWTVAREILWNAVNILVIITVSTVYNIWMQNNSLSLRQIITFECFTLIICLLPVIVTIVISESRLKKEFHKSSEQLNARLNSGSRGHKFRLNHSITGKKLNLGPDTKDGIVMEQDELIFMNMVSDVVEINYSHAGQLSKMVIPNTLENLEDNFSQNKELLRCHKDYIINLRKVIHVSGDAQGQKLHLQGSPELIPVAWNKVEKLKQRLNSLF